MVEDEMWAVLFNRAGQKHDGKSGNKACSWKQGTRVSAKKSILVC